MLDDAMPNDDNDPKLLAEINAIKVRSKELLQLQRDAEELDRADPGDEHFLANTVALTTGGMKKKRTQQDLRRFAIWCRMHAVTLLLREEGVPGWAGHECRMEAALSMMQFSMRLAVQPLIERDGEWVFERQSFLDKVLELANSEARA
jgi:hypothetical protein